MKSVKLMAVCVLVLNFFAISLGQAAWSHKQGDPMPTGGYVQKFTAEQWDASTFASEQQLKWFRDAKYGMFIHFGLSTHNNAELSWGMCETRKAPDCGRGPIAYEVWTKYPSDMKLEKFDARQWVDIAKQAGFKYIVTITKHHDGFHMWDTAQSDFKITNTPFGRDYLKEIADACHEAGMPFGVYYSQRDWYHPDYMPVDPEKVTRRGVHWTLKPGFTSPLGDRHQKYIEYQNKVVEELCTKYGKIDIFWWDACWFGGMFTAEMWDGENINRKIREWQPGIVINNRCSVPGDFDTPEGKLGNYQDWRPWESCICLTKSWSYSATAPKTREQIIRMIVNNVCCDGNLLLSWGPKWDGEYAAAEKQRLLEVGEWIKSNGPAIYGTRGGPWKIGGWGGSAHRGKTVYLHVVNWSGERLVLPGLPNRRVVSARLFKGSEVKFTENENGIIITVPKDRQVKPDTIIELTMDKSVAGMAAVETGLMSVFAVDSATYGQVVSYDAKVTASSRSGHKKPENLVSRIAADDYAYSTDAEDNPRIEIDLGKEFSVTGVSIANRVRRDQGNVKTLTMSVSTDGKKWLEVWKADEVKPVWHIPVTEYRVGAELPGRNARYIRLELHNDSPKKLHLKQVIVYGKEL